MCQVVGPCAGVVRELPLRFEAQHAHPNMLSPKSPAPKLKGYGAEIRGLVVSHCIWPENSWTTAT